MRVKKFLIYLIFTWAALFLFPESLTIYYTASLNGNLDGCDCRSVPRAGLVRTASFIRRRPDASLFFDLGDSLDRYPDEKLHTAIHGAYESLNLDCSALGDQDFIEGVDWVKNSGFPYLANNLIVDGTAFTSRHRTLAVNDFKVGVGAITDPAVFRYSAEKIRKRIVVSDPVVSSRLLWQAMEDEGVMLKVLLYHGPLEAAQAILASRPSWDVVLVGHEQRLSSFTASQGRQFLGSPGENGNRVGVLEVEFQGQQVVSLENRFQYFTYGDDPTDPPIDALLQEYRLSMMEKLRR